VFFFFFLSLHREQFNCKFTLTYELKKFISKLIEFVKKKFQTQLFFHLLLLFHLWLSFNITCNVMRGIVGFFNQFFFNKIEKTVINSSHFLLLVNNFLTRHTEYNCLSNTALTRERRHSNKPVCLLDSVLPATH